jgi:hypothetical protein
MCTELIIPAPEALVSSQLAAAVLEIEAEPETADATTATSTTGIPESTLVVEETDSHQVQMHVTLARVIDLAPKFLASKEEHAKIRLEYGREFHTLQQLHAKPGCGTFVERLKALRSKIKISQSTVYALIAEYEVSAGLRQKSEKKSAPQPVASLSSPRKDGKTRERDFSIVTNDPTLGLALERPEPLPFLDEAGTDDAKVIVQLQIPSSRLKDWDDALVILQKRSGYEAANQSELVIEAVIAFAEIAEIQQKQNEEEGEEKNAALVAGGVSMEVVCAESL